MPAVAAWTYGGNLTFGVDGYSAVDEVRFHYQDTDPNVRLLADGEVAYVTARWIGTQQADGSWSGGPFDDVLMAAFGCAKIVAAKFAGVTSIVADGVTVNVGDLQGRYEDLADQLRRDYDRISSTGADVDISNLLWDPNIDPLIRPTSFAIGMHDNPEAGQQDYGVPSSDWPGSFPDRDDLEQPWNW